MPVDEELDRTIPVLEILRAEFDVLLSIDTSTPEVMSAALAAGAGLVNDVRALTRAGAKQVVAEAQAAPAVCLMHMQGQPVSMQETFSYDSVVDEVFVFSSIVSQTLSRQAWSDQGFWSIRVWLR